MWFAGLPVLVRWEHLADASGRPLALGAPYLHVRATLLRFGRVVVVLSQPEEGGAGDGGGSGAVVAAVAVSRVAPAADLFMAFPMPVNLTRGGGYSFVLEPFLSVADAEASPPPSPPPPLAPPKPRGGDDSDDDNRTTTTAAATATTAATMTATPAPAPALAATSATFYVSPAEDADLGLTPAADVLIRVDREFSRYPAGSAARGELVRDVVRDVANALHLTSASADRLLPFAFTSGSVVVSVLILPAPAPAPLAADLALDLAAQAAHNASGLRTGLVTHSLLSLTAHPVSAEPSVASAAALGLASLPAGLPARVVVDARAPPPPPTPPPSPPPPFPAPPSPPPETPEWVAPVAGVGAITAGLLLGFWAQRRQLWRVVARLVAGDEYYQEGHVGRGGVKGGRRGGAGPPRGGRGGRGGGGGDGGADAGLRAKHRGSNHPYGGGGGPPRGGAGGRGGRGGKPRARGWEPADGERRPKKDPFKVRFDPVTPF
jgi:hypothetical protein